MSKNVAVFVDVANIFYAAKAAGVDIDYVTLLKASSAGRDLVRAYAYTGLDPDNENQRNFHEFLRRHGYKVVSKDIRKYGDGKVKANLDIELVVDMMKTARNLDIAIVISGDGDFAPAIRAVQEMGVRVEVVSFRGNTSSDLIDVADQFTDITQIAKVEKGSSRSGRRVADDDEDLSMTEVPDKQSEGTGEPRRGRGRARTRTGEPVAATGRTATGRTRRSSAEVAAAAADVPLVVLPGEKLSRVAAPAAAVAAEGLDDADAEDGASLAIVGEVDGDAGEAGGAVSELGEDGRRRRRRRGGRGRGRGRRDEGTPVVESGPERSEEPDEDEYDEPVPPARRANSTFGSVWDSQIGVPTAASGREPIRPEPFGPDDEDLDEPPIPEYLIAERRQRDSAGRPGQGRGGRGGRGGAYAAAMDRERFGGGRGSQVSRFAEGAPRRNVSPNRFDRPDRPDRGDRPPYRPESRPAPRPVSSDEPWSEVPPEIEAMLRAQLGSTPAGRPGPSRAPAARADAQPAVTEPIAAESPAAARPARRTSSRTPKAAAPAGPEASAAPDTDVAAPKRRTTRAKAADATAEAAPAKAPARRATRTPKAAASTTGATGDTAADATPEAAAAPKRRTRKAADTPS